ncbi:MAG: bifunctional hydroxymethylpyrimidine kinase/phosphomethylpyrimidine kinase [Burkholderiales bacterium]|nr:bifunctional hydroxymethylpyrimidine kinase/phosphomethylpyrimidine kinase [Burkholderiales bacterium]
MIHNVLTIAGTDPTGGAGIQADLKTFSAMGVYGMSVITALVAQNTQGVQQVYPIDPAFIQAQCDSVFSDVRVDSVKCGMLVDAEVIQTVHRALVAYRPQYIVLDTVMVAKSGDALLAEDAVRAMRDLMLPLADLITPNLPEAAALLSSSVAKSEDEMRDQAHALLQLGARAVFIKGGHLNTADAADWLVTDHQETRFVSPRIPTQNTHGTGCTLSAALAALRPRFDTWDKTAREAKTWLTGAIEHSSLLTVGQGHGPLHHFYGSLAQK